MPLKKRTLRSMLQDANRAALDVPAPMIAPEADLHTPEPSTGQVWQYGAKKNMADDLVDFEWPGHPKGEDAVPTQVFTDQEIETGKLAKPRYEMKGKRLTDKEARAQAERAERGLRGAAEEAVRPNKPLAQELAELKPELPVGPLEGQGSMEGKPVEQVIDRRGANLGRIAGERRAASGNMVSATPSNADIGMDLAEVKENALLAGRTTKPFDVGRSMARNVRQSFDDKYNTRPGYPWSKPESLGEMARSNQRNVDASMLGEMKPSEPSPIDVGREAAQYARDEFDAKATRAASAVSVGTTPAAETSVGTAGQPSRWAKIVGDASATAGRTLGEIYGAARAGAYGTAALKTAGAGKDLLLSPLKYVTEPAFKAGSEIAARNARTKVLLEGLAGKSFAKRAALGALPRAGRAAGNLASAAEGAFGVGARATGIAADIATMEMVERLARASTEARQGVNATQKAQLEQYKQAGQNYGFDVTGREGSDAYMQFKAFVGAEPKIEVKPNASLRAQYEARNKKRIQQLIRSGVVHPIATGRPTIKGNTNE